MSPLSLGVAPFTASLAMASLWAAVYRYAYTRAQAPWTWRIRAG